MSRTILNGLNEQLGRGGVGLDRGGDPSSLYSYLSTIGAIWAPPAANAAAMAAMALKDLSDGMRVADLATRRSWRYSPTSEAVDTTANLVVPVTAGGAWIRVAERVELKLAIGHATADDAVLFTVPDGFILAPSRLWWEITTGWTGGSSSAIGVYSSNATYNTAGDLLGGASGDVAATLVAGQTGGTIGASFGSNGMVVLDEGDTILFSRITSAFTAGAGFVHVLADVIT